MKSSLPESLLLSFWDLSLENFPEGNFRYRKLPNLEAVELINAIKEAGEVFCGTNHDLAAPYEADALERVKDLVRVLSKHWRLNIRIKDFFTEFDDGTSSAIPMTLYDIRSDRPLIVVNCQYILNRPPKGNDLGMSVAPDSVTFHLFELIKE